MAKEEDLNFLFKHIEFQNITGGELNMAVKIRLKRMGQKKAPFYRIVVADSRSQEMVNLSKKSEPMINL